MDASSLQVLRPGGLLVAVPMPPGVECAVARGMRAEFLFHASNAQRLRTVVEMAEAGTQVLLDRKLTLDKAPEALGHLAAGHAKGKIILAADTPPA